MPLNRLPLLLRTLPYLRGCQIAYQLRYRIGARLPGRLCFPITRPPRIIECEPLAPRTPFLQRPFIRLANIETQRFTFLNQPVTFNGPIDWQVPDMGRLWRYNLHYFDFLFPDRPINRKDGLRLMTDWIRANPAETPDAWDPFPASLRIVNWVKFLTAHPKDYRDGNSRVIASLFRQTLHLERHLEFHLLANHLFKNIKALMFAGLFFQGEDADRWYKRSLRLLTKELPEQVLADGGHFERSPMYHAMVLEDILDLLNILPDNKAAVRALRSKLLNAAGKMTGFLQAMTHPDKGIALFNDAAFGIEHTAQTLTEYYAAVTEQPTPVQSEGPLTAFPDSGYFIMRPTAGNKLIIDSGAIGPDYQPGHSHCDTLSFELSIEGQRVVVDSGCCQYEDDPIRQYNRGNAGHNTVTIDRQNQSEVWDAHRCARRAYPHLETFREKQDGTLCFQASHDGYHRLPGRPGHRRTIQWKGNRISIDDAISGQGRHHLLSALHLHPGLDVHPQNGDILVSGNSGPIMRIRANGRDTVDVQEGWYCPEFNRRVVCQKLTITSRAKLPATMGWRIQIL